MDTKSFLKSAFTEPLKSRHPAYSYGFLAVILFLLAAWILWFLDLPPDYAHDPYSGFVVVFMLLFNHLAFQFRFPVPVTVAIRIWAWLWLLFGLFYIVYWSQVLFQFMPHVRGR